MENVFIILQLVANFHLNIPYQLKDGTLCCFQQKSIPVAFVVVTRYQQQSNPCIKFGTLFDILEPANNSYQMVHHLLTRGEILFHARASQRMFLRFCSLISYGISKVARGLVLQSHLDVNRVQSGAEQISQREKAVVLTWD